MKYAEVICALIMSIILLAVYVTQSIIERKVLKGRLILAFICCGVAGLSLALSDIIEKHKYVEYAKEGLIILVYVVVCIAFFKTITESTSRSHLESEFVKTLENDKIFVLLDKKERIKQISSNLCKLAGIEKREATGKRFFDFISNNFVLLSLNDTQIKMSKVKEHFRVWAEECKEGDTCKREFLVSSKDGKETNVLNFVDNPLFTASRYSGHLLIGDLDEEATMIDAKRKLSDKSNELSNVKSRMRALFDITEESIFFYNIDENYIWGNDAFVRDLNVNGNTIARSEFEHYIHPDDIAFYQKSISGLTESKPAYDVKYRFKTGANYQFIHERGKRIFAKGADSEIAGTIEIVNDKHFEHSDMPLLDTIKDEAQMYADIETAYREGYPFEVAMFKLTNLPEINKTQGRSVGNMVLGEYIKAVNDKLVNDGMIYRISGLDFVILINDGRKMSILRTMLEKNILTASAMDYGGIHLDIKANFGVAFYNECRNAKEIIDAAERALNTSMLPQVGVDYMFYSDIK